MPYLASILVSAIQMPLVSPMLESPSDYLYFNVGTQMVKKASVPIDAFYGSLCKYAPRFSSYNNMSLKGFNSSLWPCIRGMNFTTPAIRTEDMMWINEAWNERFSVTRNSNSSGSYFPLFVASARTKINNPCPYSSISPWIISRDVSSSGGQYKVLDENASYTDEYLINLFGGDYSDPQVAFFSNSTQIAIGAPITIESITNLVHYFEEYSEIDKVIVPNVSGDETETLQKETVNGGYATIINVSYDSSHVPHVTSSEAEGQAYTNESYTSSPTIDWLHSKAKRKLYYLDSWSDEREMYTSLSGGSVSTYIDSTEKEIVVSQVSFITPQASTNYCERGGFGRIYSQGCSAVHLFLCEYKDSYNPSGLTYEGGTEVDISKFVAVVEPSSGSCSVFNSVTNEFVEKTFSGDDNGYGYRTTLSFSSVIPTVWNVAFPDKAFCTEDTIADPPSKTYNEVPASWRASGGDVSTFSERMTRHTVTYYGVWAGCCRFNFRTKGRK